METVPCDGVELACVDTGGDGPVLLLVHGFPLSHAMWREQIGALRDTVRVVAPDLRGHGASPLGDWPGDDPPSLERHADDLAALLDGLGISAPVVYCGFSMGGYIAWPFLQKHATRLSGLVLMDTRAAGDDEAGRATRLKMAEGVSEWGSARVAEMMRTKLFGPSATPSVIDETAAVIAATDPRSIAASQRAMAARPDSTPRLSSVEAPTLVICGEHDAISTPQEMRGVSDRIRGAEFVEISDAGHMAPMENPAAVSDALRSFLTRLQRRFQLGNRKTD